MYSGDAAGGTADYAYMKVFDTSAHPPTIDANTTLSYWIYPQNWSNSTCAALDMIFSDGTALRNLGAVDQNGDQLHLAHQCGHLTLNQWNHVTSKIGAVAAGKTPLCIDLGYDQPGGSTAATLTTSPSPASPQIANRARGADPADRDADCQPLPPALQGGSDRAVRASVRAMIAWLRVNSLQVSGDDPRAPADGRRVLAEPTGDEYLATERQEMRSIELRTLYMRVTWAGLAAGSGLPAPRLRAHRNGAVCTAEARVGAKMIM